jgi:hypothetical protein
VTPRPVSALLVLLVLLAGCGGGPAAVTLADLVADPDAYVGEEVRTVGTVVEFTEEGGALERHIVIEDDRNRRVALEPPEHAEPFIGGGALVTGRFLTDPERGRWMEISEIREAPVQR